MENNPSMEHTRSITKTHLRFFISSSTLSWTNRLRLRWWFRIHFSWSSRIVIVFFCIRIIRKISDKNASRHDLINKSSMSEDRYFIRSDTCPFTQEMKTSELFRQDWVQTCLSRIQTFHNRPHRPKPFSSCHKATHRPYTLLTQHSPSPMNATHMPSRVFFGRNKTTPFHIQPLEPLAVFTKYKVIQTLQLNAYRGPAVSLQMYWDNANQQ